MTGTASSLPRNWLEEAGCRIVAQAGVAYDPCRDRFTLSDDMRVNYLLAAAKPDR